MSIDYQHKRRRAVRDLAIAESELSGVRCRIASALASLDQSDPLAIEIKAWHVLLWTNELPKPIGGDGKGFDSTNAFVLLADCWEPVKPKTGG